MSSELSDLCSVIEECYEYMLAYAGQGVSGLARDARDSLAAVELVLAQPAISSQLIDNLNASIHLRALLTDLFLIDEILKGSRNQESPAGATGPAT